MLTGYNQYLNAVFDQLTRHVRDDVNPFGLSGVDRFMFLLLTLLNGLGANLPFRVLRFDPFVSTSPYAQINIVFISFFCLAGLVLLGRVRNFVESCFSIVMGSSIFRFCICFWVH